MAIRYAVASGNWSNTATWNGGTLPTSADDVYSNTFTVTINTSPTVLSISNAAATGVTAGGQFLMTNGITLTCTATNGILVTNVAIPTVDSTLGIGQSCLIIANARGGTSTTTSPAVRNSGAGTINITGAVEGASSTNSGGTAPGALNNSTGIINITGDVKGNGNNSHGAINASAGTVNITGNASGSAGYLGNGVVNSGTGTMNITGTVTGGAVSGAYGAQNASTGTINHVGAAQASAASPAFGPGAIGQITTLTGPLNSTSTAEGSAAASGVNPCVALRWFPADTALSTFTYTMRGATVSGSPSSRPARVLSLPENSSTAYPAASNVRSGTVYGVGNAYTGTCAVPGAASVAFGVPVDNTTGTAAITADSIRSALGMASANLDTQLTGIPTGVWNKQTSDFTTHGTFGAKVIIASNVQREVAVTGSHHVAADIHELQPTVINASHFATGALDGVRTSIGMASANLDTQLANLPTASENASAVRTELSTELNRLDVNVSSRLADADYQLPLDASGTRSALGMANANLDDQLSNLPTASENASTTRAELSTELSRIDAAISTRLADSDYVTPPTSSDNATATWNATTRTITGGTVDTLTNSPDVPSPEEIASQVRTEISAELSRVSNTATTQEVADIIEGALSSNEG